MKNTKTDVTITNKGIKTAKQGKITPIVPITRAKMIAMFLILGTSKIVTLISVTIPKMTVKSRVDKTIKNDFGRIEKHSQVNGFVGADYDNCVNNQLAREGKTADFKAVKPSFGEKVVIADKPNRVVEHHIRKDGEYKQYIAFKPQHCLDVVYKNDKGENVDKALLKDFLPLRSTSSRQGTDKKVEWRKYKVESIIGFRTDGVEYKIER